MNYNKARMNKRIRTERAKRNGTLRVPKTKGVLIHHAINRAKERYGQALGAEDIERMNEQIRTNQADFISAQSSNRSAFVVTYQGVRYATIYNKNLNCIITFLPMEVVEEWRE